MFFNWRGPEPRAEPFTERAAIWQQTTRCAPTWHRPEPGSSPKKQALKAHSRTQGFAPFWMTAVRFRRCRDGFQVPVRRYDPTKPLDLSIQLGVVFLELMEPALSEMSTLHLA
jgi:hypothetical protein